MSVAAARREAAEHRCAGRLLAAARLRAEAAWLYDHDLPAAAAISEHLAREEEQRAEAELRRHPATADLVVRDDYEQRLDDYLTRRLTRFGPLAALLDPDRFAGNPWAGSANTRRLLASTGPVRHDHRSDRSRR